MSLFEKLNNKRYDLQEAKSGNKNKSFPSGSFDPANQEGKFVKNEKGKNLNQTSNSEINKRLSASTTKGDQARSLYGTEGGSTEGTGGATTTTKPYTPPSKKKVKEIMDRSTLKKLEKGQGVNINKPATVTGDVTPTKPQTGVDAQTITKKYNQKNPNRKEFKKFFDPEKAKEARKNLIAKRKEYGIDRKGNISDAGVKRYAQKTKQLSSGSNVPAKVTAKDLKVAKVRAVGTGKKGADVGKYGGRLGRTRNKNMPSYAEVKAKIDAKEKVKNMYKKPKTVLKVAEPGTTKFRPSKFKGFVEVPTSDPIGKKILKKMDTTGFVPPKPPSKPPNLFQRMKKSLLDPQSWKIPKKDWDLKPTRWDKAGNVIAQQRRSFKPGVIGTVRKNLAKLPLRYKIIGGTAIALSNPGIRKAIFGGGKPAKPKQYAPYVKTLGFDTGKPNKSRELYKKYLKTNKPDQYNKEFSKKLPKSLNPYNKPTPLPSISSKDVKPPNPLSKKDQKKIEQQVDKYVSDRKK